MAPSTGATVRLRRYRSAAALACSAEKIPQPLAHRIGGLRRPFAEALAGAHAELAGGDHVLDELRRLGGAVEVGHQHVLDVESEVDADEVGLLHRSEHRHSRAETALDHLVDGVGVADARRDQCDGLALERMLQPVADEARNVFFTCTGLRPASRKAPWSWRRFVAGLFVLRHLDQRDEMRRIPEMRADHAVAVLELSPIRVEGWPSCCWPGSYRRGQVFEFGKKLLLERQLFRRGLEHEGRSCIAGAI